MQDSPLLEPRSNSPVPSRAETTKSTREERLHTPGQYGMHLGAEKASNGHGFKSKMHKMRAPLEMTLLLLLGIIGAVAHQLYYHSLHGRTVSSQNVSQEWNIRIGTGLAFLTKTGWTVAVLVAQSQQVWTTMDRKTLSVDIADAMILAPTNFLKFRHFSFVRRAKTATLLALLVWCIPLSAIFTPATLTVVSVIQPNPRTLKAGVPMIDFANATNFAALGTCSPDACGVTAGPEVFGALQFTYPNAQTVLLAAAGASSGQIQAMVPKYPNSTYTVPFFGPAIQCQNANASAAQSIKDMYSATAPPYNQYQGRPETSYYGFIPGRSKNGTLTSVDFAQLPRGWNQLDDAKIPSAPEIWIRTRVSDPTGEDTSPLSGVTTYVCLLQNASYTTQFSFHGGVQSTQIQGEHLGPVPYTTAMAWDYDTDMPAYANRNLFAYQAVWMALAQLLTGHFQDNPLTTRLFQTPIVGSREFVPYFRVNTGAATQPFARNQTVPEIIEELSRNVTVSLFSSHSHL